MGYPPIQGFETPLVAETAQIAAILKSSVGKIVCEARAYLDGNDYLLLSARVKGGNSGGPIVGKLGQVLGVITHFPADASGRPDLLGYAAALPSAKIQALINAVNASNGMANEMEFRMTHTGFSTE